VNANTALEAQMLGDPFAPIGVLAESDGHVLLMGVDHTVNTSIHYAEKIVGRKQFIRWALTIDGVRECASWPGCSAGFEAIGAYIDRDMRWVNVRNAVISTVSLERLIEVVAAVIEKDPLALLCSRQDCERCRAVKENHQEVNE
jgi:aminoglycoside 3-N-acetyltransferase